MLSRLNKQTSKGSIRPLVIFVAALWLAALGYAAINRQGILDWLKLHNYEPPAVVVQMAEQDTMTAYGRKIFYVNQPAITAKSAFATYCPSATAEQTIVLGCYHSGQSGIYLLDVNDKRLDGVEQVTAAHEMLHGAYERLSHKDKAKVDKLLNDYYQNHLTDDRIRKTVEAYKKTEPNDVINEMHSVFGTEVSSLPPALEEYYKRYFANRPQVAAFAARYQSEFTSRQDAVAGYDAQLTGLKAQIQNMESDLKTKQADINDQQKLLVAQRNGGNVTAYNAGVPGYNSLVNAYNAEVEQLRGVINQYNQLVATRNAVALEENELVKDLSTSVQTINR